MGRPPINLHIPAKSAVYRVSVSDGRAYVGSTGNTRKRFNEHIGALRRGNHWNKHLQRAFDECADGLLRLEIIEECGFDRLKEREQHYLDTLNPSCNIERTVGKALHDLWKTEDFRARNEERASVQCKERWKDDEYRAAGARRGAMAMNTPQAREKSRERLAEKWKDPAFRAAGAERIRKITHGLFADPEYRKQHSERQSALMKRRMNTPEAKAKQAARFKGVNKRPMYCITTGEYFASVADAAAAKGISVSVVNKQCRGLPTRSALQWRYLTDQELIERGHDPSKVRRDMPADRKQA